MVVWEVIIVTLKEFNDRCNAAMLRVAPGPRSLMAEQIRGQLVARGVEPEASTVNALVEMRLRLAEEEG